MAVIVLVVVSTWPVGAATACDAPISSSTFHLIAAHPTATEEVAATRDEMDEAAARIGMVAAGRVAHPLMQRA